MAIIDIFNPQISVVAEGLEGKAILVYGSNNLGKTKQATRMKKPFYMPFESGLNAIAGVPFCPINSWADFKKINKQLTDPKNLDKAKEMYQTLIFDEVDASAKLCKNYVCSKYDVERIKDGNDGFGLWDEYGMEYWGEINKLLGAGYTIIFIAHQTETKKNKKEQIYPKGDKRALAPIVDNCDIVVYLQSNGVDEDGKVVKSSAFLAETEEYFARSRFDYIDTIIEEFTAESLEKAITNAIKRQEKEEGIKAVTYTEQKDSQSSEELNHEDLVKQIGGFAKTLNKLERLDEYQDIVNKYLGEGASVRDSKPKQVEQLTLILDELKELEIE